MSKNLRVCNFFTTFAPEKIVHNILILLTYDVFNRLYFSE